jgi:hypothetical protein
MAMDFALGDPRCPDAQDILATPSAQVASSAARAAAPNPIRGSHGTRREPELTCAHIRCKSGVNRV